MRAYLYVALSFGRLPHQIPMNIPDVNLVFMNCCTSWVEWLSLHELCHLTANQHHDWVFPLLLQMWQKIRVQVLYDCLPRLWNWLFCVFIYTHLHKLMKYYDCRCRYALYIPTELVVPSPNVLKLWVFYASVFLVLWRLSLDKLTENLAQDSWLLSPLVFSAIWDPGWTWILMISQNYVFFGWIPWFL